MPKGFALVLALMVLAAALFAGWYSTTRTIYFAPMLLNQPSGCRYGHVEEAVISTFEADWFAGELRAFSEPSLYRISTGNSPGQTASYRLLWLRSFHEPIVVRIDQTDGDSAYLTAKQRAGGGGFQGRPRTLERPLTHAEISQLHATLSTTEVLGERPKICGDGLDGSRWIIEVASNQGQYSFVNRWSPRDGAVRDFGEFMLGLTGWDVVPVY